MNLRKVSSDALQASRKYEQKMKRKYGSTYFLEMSSIEKSILSDLNSKVNFKEISVDGTTYDRRALWQS